MFSDSQSSNSQSSNSQSSNSQSSNSQSSNSRSLFSKVRLSLAFSLIASFNAPFILPAITQTKAQAQSLQNQSLQNQNIQTQTAQAQPTQAQPNIFTDVSSDYWAHDYIEGLTKLNIISGFPDGTFQPNERVTRAEFAAILRRAFLQSQPITAQPFTDVPANYWATEAIYAARTAGFLSGYPGNRFEPDSPLRRDEALISLTNGLKYTGGSLETLTRYSDAESILDYARPIIATATEANLVVNYPNPDQVGSYRHASRAEVAAFVYQALVKEGRATPLVAKADSWQREPIATIPVEAEKMSFSRNGQQLVTLTSQGSGLQIWNAQTGTLIRAIFIKDIATEIMTRVEAIAISPDGRQIAAISRATPSQIVTATVWSVETGEQLWSKPLGTAQTEHSDGIPYILFPQITFSPDGEQIMTQVNLGTSATSRATNGQLRLHSAGTGEIVQSLDYAADGNAELLQFAFSPDGKFLATASHLNADLGPSFDEHRVNLWRLNRDNGFDNFQTIQLVGLTEGDFTFVDMVFTNSGLLNFLRQALYETRLDTWSLNTGQFYGRTALPDADRTDLLTRLSPDGQYYFIRGDVAGSRLGNVQTREVQKLDSIDTVAAFSRDGDYLALGNSEGIRIFAKTAP